ncbi:hypothetical protein FBU30_008600 [Linnemannia zychae]|nr:hypothetical protein FBU30_008600 [Linnemannia zychae]
MSIQDSLRIVDKRQNISGIEYLFNSGDWIPSSTSRCINPELVELYEYLHSSGFRKGATVFNPLLRPKIVLPKGARKRMQSATSGPDSGLSPSAEISLTDIQLPLEDPQKINVAATGTQTGIPLQSADQISSDGSSIEQNEDEKVWDEDSSQPPPNKKPRTATLKRSESWGMSQLSVDSEINDFFGQNDSQDSEPVTPIKPIPSPPKDNDLELQAEDSSKRSISTSESKKDMKDMAIVEFNKNTENMITVYFKAGLDATGVEMFDMILGPLRRPSKDFIAAFFYAVVLSPLTEPATIEAAIHVLDRVLTLHGPEPFQAIWDVPKRRREFADGGSPFSKVSATCDQDPDMRPDSLSTRSSSINKKPLTLRDLSSAALAGRLPSWSDIWDVIKAELGLDTKDESKQHITLQEHQIRLRLQGNEADITEHQFKPLIDELDDQEELDSKPSKHITEEQEIREECGRTIVSFLLRVMEQDSILNDMSPNSFFYRDALRINRYTSNHSVRQLLDLAFQIVGLATSSRYFEPHPQLNSTSSTASKSLTKSNRTSTPWPLNERCALNPTGLEILQLGQQIILMLVRFTQAGELLPGKGLEELAREVISRLKAGTGFGASVKLRKDTLQRHQHQQANNILNRSVNGVATDSVAEQEDSNGVFKSQIGTCTGSSVFVMVLVDYWFRNHTTVNYSGNMLSFRVVVEKYTMPGQFRPSSAGSASSTPIAESTPTAVKSGSKRSRRGRTTTSQPQSPTKQDPSDDEIPLTNTENTSESGDADLERWNAKDLEEIEWTVMMTEVLVWAWIEARGIRQDEIRNTGLEQVLFPDEAGKPSLEKYPESGWLHMSKILNMIGGSLKMRWEQLESVIEVALLVEDLGLR